MKRKNLPLFVLLVCFVCIGSWLCASKKPSQYYVEIKDRCNTDFSRLVLEKLRNALHEQVYVYAKGNRLMLKQVAERDGVVLDKSASPHEMIVGTAATTPGTIKITMRFNPPDAAGRYSAHIVSYDMDRDHTWKMASNAGKHSIPKEMSVHEISEYLVHSLVTHTYKLAP